MPGDHWQQFANLRLLYSYMFMHPGAKLLFMGAEFAQHHEWRHDHSLDWHENEVSEHNKIQSLIKSLNELIVNEKSFHSDFEPDGFRWIDLNDSANSVLCWQRVSGNEGVVVVANFTPVVRKNYRIGCPHKGTYNEILNSDDLKFGGSGVKNDAVYAVPIAKHGYSHSLSLILPPLGLIVLKRFEPAVIAHGYTNQ
jgi:1,4-alpha-glucan branching enzyme